MKSAKRIAEERQLAEAKRNFVASMEAFAPSSVVRNSPLSSAAIAAGSGIALAVTGLRMSRSFIKGVREVAGIFKK